VTRPPAIDRFSETPRYVQIAEHLAAEIRSGEREPGSRLPSIVDLVQMTGVNRQTAAKALRLLGSRRLARLSPGEGWYVPNTPAN
jgi:GntR family transcriptional regulator